MKAHASASGVAAAAAALALALLGLGLLRRGRQRPAALPVARCPIHGIAYDAELEICPDCAKTDAPGKGDAR